MACLIWNLICLKGLCFVLSLNPNALRSSLHDWRHHKNNKINLYLFPVLSGLHFLDLVLNFAITLCNSVDQGKEENWRSGGQSWIWMLGRDGRAWCAGFLFHCRWPFWCVAERESQTDTGSASSSIKGLKLFQFLRGQVRPASAQPVSFYFSASISSLPFCRLVHETSRKGFVCVGQLLPTPCWCLDFLQTHVTSLSHWSLHFYMFFFWRSAPRLLLSNIIKWAELFSNIQILKETWRV